MEHSIIAGIKKKEINPVVLLPLMEAYYTIQGEGFHAGAPAWFIRLGGCDVGCSWCDTKNSWKTEAHALASVDEIIQRVIKPGAVKAVITGGEPAMHNLDELTKELVKAGLKTHVETSGAYNLTGLWNWICLSPKKTMPPVGNIHKRADELKIIIYKHDDFLWAEEHAARVTENCLLYLQPEWSRSAEMLPDIIKYVKNHPEWNISLQTHKYLNIP